MNALFKALKLEIREDDGAKKRTGPNRAQTLIETSSSPAAHTRMHKVYAGPSERLFQESINFRNFGNLN